MDETTITAPSINEVIEIAEEFDGPYHELSGPAADLEFDSCHCKGCERPVGGHLVADPETGHDRARWEIVFMDAEWNLWCEDCLEYEMPPRLSKSDLQRMIEQFEAEAKAAPELIRDVLNQPRSEWKDIRIRTGWGGELIPAETLELRTGGQGLRLTQDGQYAMGETWHSGIQSGEDVYFEVWAIDTGRRISHGYVDSVSRYLVQTG
jgi:hypothetical protein